jgi:MYXO-CTERM domain-containing protein
MRRVSPLALFVAATTVLAPAVAGAHARLLYPTPRNTNDGNKMAVAPCGGPRSNNITVAKVGSLLRVTWEETIDHAGHYELLWSSANDANFTFLANGAGTMLNNITDTQGGTLPHRYQAMVKLPDTPCDACTLQMKQFMSETNTYFSCADIRLVPANADLGASVIDPVDMGATSGGGDPDGGTGGGGSEPGTDPGAGGGGNNPGGDPMGGGNGNDPALRSASGCSATGGESSGNIAWPLIGVLLVAGLRPTRPRRRD